MDILIISILVIILGSAAYYIYREKKRGKKCVGCPYSNGCCNQSKTSSACNSCMNNGSQET